MARTGPTTLMLPPFSGATRRLILASVAIFFALALLGLFSESSAALLMTHLSLVPALLARGELWQLATFSFINVGIVSTAFALLTLWFIGPMLEGSFGARWLYELFFVSAIGGGLLAALISFTRILGLSPRVGANGPYAGVFGMLVAIAVYFGEQEFLLLFLLRMKAKYLVAIYIVIELALLVKGGGAFDALVQLAGGLCGYAYLKFAPRRGLVGGLGERYFAMRNEFYRSKRRRAAKKFEVYMRKQGTEVHFDSNGRYVDPDDRDPTDKKWMN
jgi:membrane associated rhomboid family serine protease